MGILVRVIKLVVSSNQSLNLLEALHMTSLAMVFGEKRAFVLIFGVRVVDDFDLSSEAVTSICDFGSVYCLSSVPGVDDAFQVFVSETLLLSVEVVYGCCELGHHFGVVWLQ